jgi:hypothetical protein
MHGWPHAGVATANPSESAAASQPVRSHTRAHTTPSCTGCQGISCGWPVAGRAAARAAGIPAAPAIRGSRAASPVKEGFLIYLNSRKYFFPLKNPRKSILTPKNYRTSSGKFLKS